jgi:hypothetical protein
MGFKRHPPAGNVRRVACTGLNIRGVMTNKAGRIVQFESQMEHALILRLERDPNVVDYNSQPERFRYVDPEGNPRTHVPDFKVWLSNGEVEIHEVTRLSRQWNRNERWREAGAREICKERSWSYVVHNEQTLPSKAQLSNLLFLFSYRPAAWANPEVTRLALNMLEQDAEVLLPVLVQRIALEMGIHPSKVVGGICHLIWNGKIQINWNKLLFIDAEFAPNVLVWATYDKEAENEAPAK